MQVLYDAYASMVCLWSIYPLATQNIIRGVLKR